VTELRGREIAGTDDAAPLAGHLSAASQRWNRPFEGRFCIFREGDAYRTENCAIERRIGPWSRE